MFYRLGKKNNNNSEGGEWQGGGGNPLPRFVRPRVKIKAGLPRAKRAWDRAPYPKIMVNLFSFGCHVIAERTYVRTRLRIVRVG